MLLCAAAVLAAAQAATANRVQTNPADQAAAKHGVLRLADLPPITSWKAENVGGGGASASASSSLGCKGYDPKDSDLVTTGQAMSQFGAPGAELQNQVTMLSTARMVELDWRRTITVQLQRCLREAFVRGGGGLHVVSLRKVPFPKVAPHTVAYRLIYGMKLKGKSTVGAADFIILAGGRFEITFFLVANLGSHSQVTSGEAGMTIIERALAGTVAERLLKRQAAPKPFTA
jgi:hypothetical protein